VPGWGSAGVGFGGGCAENGDAANAGDGAGAPKGVPAGAPSKVAGATAGVGNGGGGGVEENTENGFGAAVPPSEDVAVSLDKRLPTIGA